VAADVAACGAPHLYPSKWETKRDLFSANWASDVMVQEGARIQDVTAKVVDGFLVIEIC
jgi:hypothetical protein